MLDKPNNTATGSFSFLQTLDRALRLYRANFVPFFLLAAIVQIPTVILNLALGPQQDQVMRNLGISPTGAGMTIAQAQMLTQALAGTLIFSLVVIVLAAFLQMIVLYGPVAYIVSESYLGRTRRLSEAIPNLSKRLGVLISAIALYMGALVIFGIMLGLAFFLCGLGVGLLIYAALAGGAFLVPVFVLERTTIQNGLARAWSLGKSRIWQIIGLVASVVLISFVVDFAVSLVLGALPGAANSSSADNIVSLLDILISAVISPIVPIMFTLLYFDARVRAEGLDIALRAASATTPEPTPADVVSPPPSRFIAREDLLNIGLVCVGMFVLVLILVGIAFVTGGGAAGLSGLR